MYWGFNGGCDAAGIDASRARSHEPVMSGTLAAVWPATLATAVSIRTNVTTIRMQHGAARKEILFALIGISLLFPRPLESVRRRHRQFLLLAIRQRDLEQQARRLAAQKRRKDDFHFVTGFDHV